MSFDGVRNTVDNEVNQLNDRINQYSGCRDRFSKSSIANAFSWVSAVFSYPMSSTRTPFYYIPDGYHFGWYDVFDGLSDISRFVSDFWYRPGLEDALKYVDRDSDEFREYAGKFKLANTSNYISWGAAAINQLNNILFATLVISGKMNPARFQILKNMEIGSRLTKYATRALADYLRPGPIQLKSLTTRVSQNIRGQVNELETQFRQIGERNQVLRTQNARLLENRDSYIEPIEDSYNTNT